MSAHILYSGQGDLAKAIRQLSAEHRAKRINILIVTEDRGPRALEEFRDEILSSNIYDIAVYLIGPEEIGEMSEKLDAEDSFTLIIEKAEKAAVSPDDFRDSDHDR